MTIFAHGQLYFSLFLIGLLGSAHCLGMCGGLQQLLVNLAPKRQASIAIYLYNVGRISSYVIITMLTATLFTSFTQQTQALIPWANILRISAALLIIWLGINQLIRLPIPINFIRFGQQIWTKIRRFASPILPPKNLGQILLVGMIWGWVPCSLVYSALIITLSANDTASSGLAMLAFGLGTMPTLIGMATFTNKIKKKPLFKPILAVTLIAIGSYGLLMPLLS